MYPLPHELSSNIRKLVEKLGLDAKTKQILYDRIVCFVVRENRKLRQQVLQFRRNMLDMVEQEEQDYGEAISSYAAEETALHFNENFLKKYIYVDSKARRKRQKAVDKLVDDLYKEDRNK